MKNILITGWTWYIWSHFVVKCFENWYNPVILDNLSNSSIETLKWIEEIIWQKVDFFKVDLRNKLEIEEIFKQYNFDSVVHFAWLKAVWESCQKPIKYFQNNISWSLNLFEIMEKFSVKNLIFSSSATVYDFDWTAPFSENSKIWKTTNPYWTSKFLLEKIIEDLTKFSWFNAINLRYFNPIWAHKSWKIWENPNWIPNNLLPFLMKVWKWELDKITIFWDNFDTKDWTWERDFIDISDLINWHILALKKLENSSKNIFENINLGNWKKTSVLEMIKITEKVIWKEINFEIWKKRDWDVAISFCENEKAKDVLWWEWEVWIEESVRGAWEFYRNYEKGKYED